MPPAPKPVSASAINDQIALVFPDDLNNLGTLFGGRAIEKADEVAAVVAKRHAGVDCVTLGIDSVRFLAPARHGDVLVFKAAVNRVWRTSMEVGIKIFADDFRTQLRTHIVSAYFTFVAVDRDLEPIEISPVIAQTPDELRRYDQAEKRRAVRIARQSA